MESTFKLFRVAGITIGIHYTWIFAVIFFSWTLAAVYFPAGYPGWSTAMYWITGIATITDVKKVPQAKWATTPVSKIMTSDPLYTVTPEDNLNKALTLIARNDVNQVVISDQGKCGGLLSRGDIIRLIQMHSELGIR